MEIQVKSDSLSDDISVLIRRCYSLVVGSQWLGIWVLGAQGACFVFRSSAFRTD